MSINDNANIRSLADFHGDDPTRQGECTNYDAEAEAAAHICPNCHHDIREPVGTTAGELLRWWADREKQMTAEERAEFKVWCEEESKRQREQDAADKEAEAFERKRDEVLREFAASDELQDALEIVLAHGCESTANEFMGFAAWLRRDHAEIKRLEAPNANHE